MSRAGDIDRERWPLTPTQARLKWTTFMRLLRRMAVLMLFVALVSLDPRAAAAEEVAGASLLSAVLRASDGAPIGTVRDFLMDTVHDRISFIAVTLASSKSGVVAVPWSSLHWSRNDGHGFVATLIDYPLPASPYDEGASQPGNVDFLTAFRGRAVRAANGAEVGDVEDVIIALPEGKPEALVVSNATGKRTRQVPFCDVADFLNSGPIVIDLEQAQVGWRGRVSQPRSGPPITPGVIAPATIRTHRASPRRRCCRPQWPCRSGPDRPRWMLGHRGRCPCRAAGSH